MEDENIYQETTVDEIGYLAKLIDTNLSIFERMKIKKTTLKKIAGALLIYSATMITFILIL
jgi:hypothetical protein